MMDDESQHRCTLIARTPRGGVGRRHRSVTISSSLTHHHTCITGELIRVFQPVSRRAYSVIFSHVDADVLYAVSDDQTVRLSLADGSITQFNGRLSSERCFGDILSLSDDGTVLCVGIMLARCVVAYDVATLQLIWRVDFERTVCSIAYHDGSVLVAVADAPVTVLSAEDGSVVRRLGDVDGMAFSMSVFAGLAHMVVVCCCSQTKLLGIWCVMLVVVVGFRTWATRPHLTFADQPSSSLKFSD